MSPVHEPLPPNVSFPALEEQVLARWRERDIFKASLRNREGAPPFVFYEGPPTANGYPGAHHVLARVFKDVFPRYKTMTGHYVERKGGWDCHGLAVEIAVEQKLGFKSKDDIERYGIAEFNRQCRESVLEHLEDWQALTERIAYWVDMDDAYYTLDPRYVESVWWALKTMWERDLLYEGHKVVPYCARCGTALSSHEVAQGYEDVEDPSVYVRLPVTRPAGALREGDTLLIWTTTPWTLVSNAAVAVDPELTYVRTAGGEVLAEALAERVLGEGVEIADRFPGSELIGAGYEPPFPFIPADAYGEKGHTVLPGDFVTAEDGTGIVHTAIAFGEDDFRLGAEQGLEVVNPVRLDGTYDERIGPYAGRWVKDADPDLIEDLRARGRLLRSDTFLHSYPHCWRCGTPLIYYAKPSWYIRTSALRDRLLAANETVQWYPSHIKHGRFGKWLENNVDWAISRERYWGTPLPVWRCENGHAEVLGSLAEVQERSGRELPDPHRPYVDEHSWPCAECGGEVRRVPEVIDVWFDSGSMPFAQRHAPFENEELFRETFPADYICEAIDQTRGWFYSLLAISTLLFEEAPYRTVLVLGHIADPQGKKMSKSLGNIVVPWDVIHQHGADAFRWYYLTSKQPWDGYLFSTETVGESVRQFLLQLWNTYGFYVLYANANGVDRAGRAGDRARPLGDLAPERDDRRSARADGGLRRHAGGPGDRCVRRRALELVRAALAPPLLGRRPGRLRDAEDVPRRGHEAAGAVHAARRRRDLREPRRQPRQRAPGRLPRSGRARRGAGDRDGRGARDRPPRPRGAQPRQAQAAPAAARRRRGCGRRGAGGDRAPCRDRLR